MAAEWKANTLQASRAPLKPTGNKNMTVPSKCLVLITLRRAAMDQSYLTRQAQLGRLQNEDAKEMGYFKVQWYLQDLT